MISTKQRRLINVNEFIKTISNCGRKFFQYKGFVSYFEISNQGHVFFIDYYSKKRIYTHKIGEWTGFTSGGGLKSICEALRDYITKEEFLSAKYFSSEENSNYWAYGDDILIVKDSGLKLGILK